MGFSNSSVKPISEKSSERGLKHFCPWVNIEEFLKHIFQLQRYGPAYDVLTDARLAGKPTILASNLKLLVLTEVDRLKDAILLLRSEVLPSRDQIRRSLDGEHKNQVFGNNNISVLKEVFVDTLVSR